MNRNPARSCPAAPAQNPLWLLQQLDPHSSAYNLAFHLELTGPLDPLAMQAAWRQVVSRHPILRCRFFAGDDGARLDVMPESVLPLTLEAVDAAGLPARIQAHAHRPFDLAAGPPARALLLRVGEDRHCLCFAFHHAVFDGWSLNLLLVEMATGYNHALGHGAPLPPLPRDYLDHAQRAAAEYRVERWPDELGYWQGHLHGAPAEVDLPSARRAPPTPRAGRTHRVTYPGLAEPLAAFCARAEATPFMVMLAAYGTLLGRYTDADDLVVGTPLATRLRPDVRPLIGLFLNTVALRVPASDRLTFLELVTEVKEVALGAFRNYRVPFERVVEALHPARRTGHNPLFSTMFITQNAPVSYEFRGLAHHYVDDDPPHVKFDLTMSTQVTEQDLVVGLEYAEDRLDAATAEGMVDAYRVLLSNALEDPECAVNELSWLDRAAASKQRRRWAGPKLEAELVPTLNAIEGRVRADPGRVAVRSPEATRTYGEVWANATRLAKGLIGAGVGIGDRVGIRVQRDVALPETFLGVMLSGAAYIPLDPDAPAKRRKTMLEDAQAPFLLVDAEQRGEAPKTTRVLQRDALPSAAAALPPRPRLDDPAYIIYTSGSSGRPKGVHVPHRALSAFHAAAIEALGLSRDDVLLASATVTFDPSILEIMTSLTLGASCYVVEREVKIDGQRLARALADADATVFQTTPTALRMLVQAGWQPASKLMVLVGGEALPRDLAAQLVGRVRALFNIYGPTEATVWSAAQPVTAELLQDCPDVVPLGGVFPDARYYLLDARGRPVPPGARGEICISGPQVSDGYLARPALNASRFVSDPYRPDAVMYRTGDIGRGRADDSIEFLGRSDFQFKIRGFRIEPAEIETVLRRQPGLHDAVVTTVEREGHRELVAYVVADGMVSQDHLQTALRDELPSYMVPGLVHALAEIPRNPNGKLDRARLPKIEALPRARPAAEPRDAIEARLLELWRGLLGRRDVGIHDNFFDVGGHSMLAARLAKRVNRGFEQALEVSTFFHAQTVAQQAEAIRNGGYRPTYHALDPIKPSGTRRPWFYIGASDQARLLAEHLDKEQPMYALKVLGLPDEHSMDVEAVAAAYVEEIRSLQPEGPYLLGSFCQDAKLALSVAEHLQAQGETIARMVYIDVVWLPLERSQIRRQFVDNVTDMGPEYALHWVRQRAVDRVRGTSEHVYDLVRGRWARTRSEPAPLTTRQRQRIRALRRSMAASPERAFRGDVDLLLSQEYHRPEAQSALQHMASGAVTVYEIPGVHHGLFFPPSVYWMASRISRCLEAALNEVDGADRAALRPRAASNPA